MEKRALMHLFHMAIIEHKISVGGAECEDISIILYPRNKFR